MSARIITAIWRSVMNARPHPGPLPQERENHPPDSGDANLSKFSGRLMANVTGTEASTVTSNLFSDTRSFSISPGERAGVRASVNTILFGKELAHA